MTYDQIVKHYGGVTKAAIQLGYTRAAIYYWRMNGISERTQQQIQWLTNGKLKANGK